jgi:heptosyltransferase III
MTAHPLETLVVHPGALGDVLQAVPALRALTALGHRLTFAGQPRLGELLRGLGVVPACLSFDGFGFEALFVDGPPPAPLRSRLGQFRRAVSWFGSRDACYQRQLATLVPERIVASPVPDPASPCTVWKHLMETLAPWQVTDAADVYPLSVPETWRRAARARLAAAGADSVRPFLLAHPGAGARWKQSAAPAFVRAMRRMASEGELAVVVHQGPADRAAADALAAGLDEPMIRLVEPSLPELAGALTLAAAYLGSDSGVSHLAASVGTPSLILYPPETLRQWAPWSPSARPASVGAEGEPS